MPVEQASKVVSMRPIIEQLVVKVANNPSIIVEQNVPVEHQKILSVVGFQLPLGSIGLTYGSL